MCGRDASVDEVASLGVVGSVLDGQRRFNGLHGVEMSASWGGDGFNASFFELGTQSGVADAKASRKFA